MPSDREYFERRYRQAIDAAERAHYPNVASIHRELAARYAEALAQMDQGRQNMDESGTLS